MKGAVLYRDSSALREVIDNKFAIITTHIIRHNKCTHGIFETYKKIIGEILKNIYKRKCQVFEEIFRRNKKYIYC